MLTDFLLKNVARHISLDQDEASYFISLVKERKIPRKSVVLEEAQICREICFVQSGALRAFYRDKTGKESTIMFATQDWWITDMFSFINQQPTMVNIEAIEDSIILPLRKDDLDILYIKVPKFERFFRIIMQNAYIREQVRVTQNLSLSAEERYHIFLEKYPQVAQKVTQKQIASYLGITPEFLSSIRRNKTRRGIS